MTILKACLQLLFTAGKSIRVNTGCRSGKHTPTYSACTIGMHVTATDRRHLLV